MISKEVSLHLFVQSTFTEIHVVPVIGYYLRAKIRNLATTNHGSVKLRKQRFRSDVHVISAGDGKQKNKIGFFSVLHFCLYCHSKYKPGEKSASGPLTIFFVRHLSLKRLVKYMTKYI